MDKLKKRIFVSFVLLGVFLLSVSFVLAGGPPSFRTGDIVIAKNNTTDGTPGDSVTAEPGNVIEFKMMIQNMTQDSIAKNVLVGILWPQTPSKTLVIAMEASADGVKVSDSATVNVINSDSTHLLDYYHGHSRVFSPACPNGCNLDDTAFLNGEPINIGELAFGESAQVFFKASVNQPVAPTATPTPTGVEPTATPTPTGIPTNTPTPTPTGVAPTATPTPTPIGGQCQAGQILAFNGNSFVCIPINNTVNNTFNPTNNNTNNNSQEQNNRQTQTVNVPQGAVVAAVPGTTVTSVTTLPKTGLPLGVWGLSSLVPLGFGLKKFGKIKGQGSLGDALSLFKKREFRG